MVAEVRRVVDDLRPRALDQFGLVGALRQRCQTFQTREGLALVELRLQSALPELPAAVEVAAFRIATEALTNAARHAHATRCRIELDHEDRALSVIIRDNGILNTVLLHLGLIHEPLRIMRTTWLAVSIVKPQAAPFRPGKLGR